MNTELNTGILVTGNEANMYRIFQSHNEKFCIMLNAGVFDFDYGQVEMNYNNSQIQNIVLHRRTYKREI